MEEYKDFKIKFLEEKIKNLEKELQDTKIHLQKYTNPQRHKKYQEKNKEKIQEYAKEYSKKFLENECILLETIYINSKTKMKYKCVCKNEYYTTWSNFNAGYIRCRDCANENIEKNSFQFKDYILPSKKIIRIQGYENIALDELLCTIKEDDIILSKRHMPKIEYIIKNKKHRYYPDIWIKSVNKIIEVKSHWTYKKELIKNIKKALATRKLGYDFEFWIYDKYEFNKTII